MTNIRFLYSLVCGTVESVLGVSNFQKRISTQTELVRYYHAKVSLYFIEAIFELGLGIKNNRLYL